VPLTISKTVKDTIEVYVMNAAVKKLKPNLNKKYGKSPGIKRKQFAITADLSPYIQVK
jgi:hypothetical protein